MIGRRGERLLERDDRRAVVATLAQDVPEEEQRLGVSGRVASTRSQQARDRCASMFRSASPSTLDASMSSRTGLASMIATASAARPARSAARAASTGPAFAGGGSGISTGAVALPWQCL